MAYVRQLFKRPTSITAEALSSTTAGTPTIHTGLAARSVRVQCTTGLLWVSPLSTAPTSSIAWRLDDADGVLDLRISQDGYLAVLGDSTTAKHQLMVFED